MFEIGQAAWTFLLDLSNEGAIESNSHYIKFMYIKFMYIQFIFYVRKSKKSVPQLWEQREREREEKNERKLIF